MSNQRRRIVVLRHGRTAWNEQRRFQGRTDLPLDDVGTEQAHAAGERLGRLDPTVVVSSDATRAAETTEALTKHTDVEPVFDPRLREADIGEWEGRTRDEVQERFPEEYRSWRLGHDVRRGGGETYADVAERALPAIESALEHLKGAQTLVAVTHGGTARALLGRLLGLPPETWRSLGSLAHGRWAVLEETAFGWRLDEHNVKPRRTPKQ
jgi:glucosyl-3-phosphoglycerate phosphatase